MGGKQACCCGRGCIILADDFERVDSPSPGSDWVEISGDWDIDSGDLVETTGEGIIRTARRHPANHWTGLWELYLGDLQYGNRYRLLFNLGLDVITGDPYYYYIEYYYWSDGGNPKITLTLGENDGSDESEIQTDTIDGPSLGASDKIVLCRDLDGVYYFTEGSAEYVECEVLDNGGRYSGIGAINESEAETRFERFYWEEHYYTNHDCTPCVCTCESYCIPQDLLLTFEADFDLDGLSVAGSGSPMGDSTWQFDFVGTFPQFAAAEEGCLVSGYANQSFKLLCPYVGPEQFTEYEEFVDGANFSICDITAAQLPNHSGWTHVCYASSYTGAYASDHTCDPLWWKFGPFELRQSVETPEGYVVCGTYYIHITKVP